MGLVDEQVIDAEFVKDQPVVFFVFSEQILKLGLAVGFLLLDRLDDVAVAA